MKPKMYVGARTQKEVEEIGKKLEESNFKRAGVTIVENDLFEEMLHAWHDIQDVVNIDGKQGTHGFPMAVIFLEDK